MTAPNVLLVTVDCLRRDRLSAYGYPRVTTPFLDSLLATSLHASQAYAPAPWTAPSVASLLTGRYPSSTGAGLLSGPEPHSLSADELPNEVPQETPLLQELLPQHATAAFVGVWNAALPFGDRLGKTEMKERGGIDLVTRALRWTRKQEGTWCCWVHLREPHDPLEVPRASREMFGPTGRYSSTRRWAFTGRNDDLDRPAFGSYRDARTHLYDAAVFHADRAIEQLVSSVDPSTIVVITADHGEEMWEHRDDEIANLADPRGVAGVGHGHALWPEVLLVPLIVHGPGIDPREESNPVSLVDVVPTILDAQGLLHPAELDGVSLLEQVAPDRIVIAEGVAYGNDQRVAIGSHHSWYESPSDGFARATRLDPRTHLDIEIFDVDIDGPSSPIERLQAALAARSSHPGGLPVALTDEVEAHLRSLGYLG